MKILLLTHGAYLDGGSVVSGNSVRAHFLSRGLVENGIAVTHCYPAGLGDVSEALVPIAGVTVRTYRDRGSLSRLLESECPDYILVGYWELLEDLPSGVGVPVVVDVLAPRVLESVHEGG